MSGDGLLSSLENRDQLVEMRKGTRDLGSEISNRPGARTGHPPLVFTGRATKKIFLLDGRTAEGDQLATT